MAYNPIDPNGATTAANSAPVALATDQLSTLATAANQTTANSSLSSITTNTANTATNTSSTATNTTNLPNVIGTAAAAVPSKLLQVGGSDGTNARAIKTDTSGNVNVNVQGTVPVSGTFWQTTQPVSAASLPLPSGAAQDATLTGGTVRTKVTDGTNNAAVKAASTAAATTDPALVVAVSPNNSVAVTGTFYQAIQPVSAASLPLPTGAATAAKQPALGTAGTAATDVLTVQGIASMTALKVDGSAVTQPVSLATNTPTLQAGTNTIGDVNLTAAARGGYAVSSQTALAGTTATVSSAAGKFGGFMFSNLNAAPAYIQVFDTTGAVTLGTTAPTFVIPIPANATAANGVAAVHEFSVGIAIANGIKIAATTTATGSTGVATGLTGFVLYK